VLNAASLNIDNISQIDQVAAGSYVSLYGTSLAKGIDGPAFPLPPGDQGTQVKLGNRTLLMTYVEPRQVNVLLPSDLPPGPQQLTMVREGLPSVKTLQIPVTTSAQPGIFPLNSVTPPQGAVRIASTGAIAAPAGSWPGSAPAKMGADYIEIYCTGLGPVSNSPEYGVPAAGGSLVSETLTKPVVTIGDVPATVTFSGLSPGSVALYQVDALVPAEVAAGDAVPVVLQMPGGAKANTVTIAVQ
jgi:uncharacterized protein (TIGR03437 family)